MLEEFAAAVLLSDPGAHVIERGPRTLRLKTGDSKVASALLVHVESLDQLEADVREALGHVKPGTVLRVVAIDARRLGAEATLKRQVSAVQVRSVVQAFAWAPPDAVVVARGGKWPALESAVKRLKAGQVVQPAAIIAERASRAAEADRFLAPLLKRKPWVTWAVAATSVVLFGLQMLWGNGEAYAAGMRMGASVRTLIEAGQVWRLVAPMVLHGSWLHLVANMLALFSFGTFLERFLGWRRYLILYVAAGLGGGIASYLRPNEVISVGASGGVWGLMLVGAVLVTWPRGRLPQMVSAAQRRRAWSPVVINGLYSLQPGIDLLAHFGGGAVGALLMFSGLLTVGMPSAEESDPARPPTREGAGVNALVAVSVAVLVAAVAAAFVTGRPWELRSRPVLTRTAVPGGGASLELPHLVGPPLSEAENQYSFGRLAYDPVSFMLILPQVEMTDEEMADLKAAMHEVADTLNAPEAKGQLLEGFSRSRPFEVRARGEVPYVFGQQTASDGRVAETYWLPHGRRMAMVMVLWSAAASPDWRAAASSVPFTLQLAASEP